MKVNEYVYNGIFKKVSLLEYNLQKREAEGCQDQVICFKVCIAL